jgi:hypothetical protein
MGRLLWTQKQDIGPSARQSFDMTYDAGRRRTILFGGASGGPRGDTWEWDGEDWVQTADIGPSPRVGHAVAYDAQRGRLVLFGGSLLSGGAEMNNPQAFVSDTWEWDGEDWTQVADSGPSARYFLAMAYDAKRHRVLLFGGATWQPTGLVTFADTWSWDGSEWTQEQDEGPAGRNGHRLAYDSTRDRVVLFGGATSAEIVNDTWEYDGSLWKHVADNGPRPRAAHTIAYDGAKVLLFGGWDLGGNKFGDTWGWDGKYWTQRQNMGPEGRASHGMAYDSDRNRIVLFGGNSNRDLGDTWEAFERPSPPVG